MPDPEGGRPSDDRREAARHGPSAATQNALYGSIRWIVGHVRSLSAALGFFLGGALAISAATLALFSWIAYAMAAGATQRIDRAVVELLRANAAPVWDWLALAGAGLGSGAAMWVVLILGTVLLWRSRRHYSVLLLWVALLGGRVLNHGLKTWFARPRPEAVNWEVDLFGRAIEFPTSFSFPSGHATTAVVVFGTVAYLVARLEPTPTQRRWTLAGAGAVILLIGWSRLYMGVHYLSDVIAGYLSGLLWATLVALGIEVIRYFAESHPDVADEERDVEKGVEPLREAVRAEEG